MSTVREATNTTEPEGRAIGRLSLYGLTPSWEILWNSIEAAGGEVTEADESAMDRLIAATTESMDRAGGAVYALEREAEEIGAEIKRLHARKQQRENAADRVRDLMGRCLDAAEMKSVKGMRFSVTRTSGRPSVNVHDVTAIPDEFMVQRPPEPDKKAIGEALKNGKSIPGAEIVIGRPGLLIR